ncbi:MAG: glycosyltransferase family 4 protein [Thermoplasmata archaeon]|nr:glycosyltransferase family 4 protein [Thermoplasmata archaeon]
MRLLFIPEQIQHNTNERTPKLREILAESHTVVGVEDKLAIHVYNQKKLKAFRFLLYLVNNAYMFWSSLRKTRKHRVQLIFCEGLHCALIGVLVSKMVGKPCVFDSHGNTSTFYEQLGKSGSYIALSLALEKALIEQSAALITVSKKDKLAYEKTIKVPIRIHVIPTSIDFSMVSESSASREEVRRDLDLTSEDTMLLFFGALDYAPNKEAVDYINKVLAPELGQMSQNVRICIAGRGDTSPVTPHNIVSILGFVPNIYDLIRASDICVAPLWSGVGILTKVLDMMACGKPVVVTPLAKDGIPELKDNWNVILAANKEDFIRRTIELVETEKSHRLLGERARELIREKYTWDIAREKLDDLLVGLTECENREDTKEAESSHFINDNFL